MQLSFETSSLKESINDFFLTRMSQYATTPEDTNALACEEAAKRARIHAKLAELKLVLAGGAITSLMSGKHINDLDFYLEDPEKRSEAVEFLSEFFNGKVFVSSNCITFKRKSPRSNKVWTAQLITRFSGKPEDIFRNFDFTITTGAYQFSQERFVFGERFWQDLGMRRLTYLGSSRYPICALYRTKKYQERGYSCPGSTVMHIGLAIVQLEIKTYSQLKEQLLGIDTMYLQNLREETRFGPDLPVDFGEFVEAAFERMNVSTGEFDEGN